MNYSNALIITKKKYIISTLMLGNIVSKANIYANVRSLGTLVSRRGTILP